MMAGDMNKNDFMERQKAAEAEEEAERQKAAFLLEEEAKEKEMQKYFVERDENGEYTRQYDRKKKFGEIMNDEQLVYEPPEELEEAEEALHECIENIESDPTNIDYIKMKIMLTGKIAELNAKGAVSGKGQITTSYKLNLPPEYYMK
jgi:DNA repair ATPase RecN